jgi:phospholipid transport system substrate-binding protein
MRRQLQKCRIRFGAKLWLCLVAACAFYSAAQATEQQDPQVLVDTTIETLRKNVIRDAALLERDPVHALMLVENIVAPHIDMRLASRLVLGRHWQAATELQQNAFVDGLRGLLLRIFAIHVRDYSDVVVAYQPTELMGKGDRRAIVRSEVSRPGTPSIGVDYRMRRTGDVWKIYDVSILGVSLVKTYHITIDGELERHGIDGVIARINAKNPLQKAGGTFLNEAPPAG